MGHIHQTGPVVINKDTIICIGNGVDHDNFNYYAAYVAKFDMQGNFIKRFVDIEPKKYYSINNLHIAFMIGDTLYFGIDIHSGTYFVKYLITSDSILKKIKVKSLIDEWSYIQDVTKINDSLFIVLLEINEKPGDKYLNTQISIMNTKEDSIIKNIVFGKMNYLDIPQCAIWNGEKLVVGMIYEYPYDVDFDEEQEFYAVIYEVDTSGNAFRQYKSIEGFGGILDIIQVPDGYLCLSEKVSYTKIDTIAFRIFRHQHPVVIKLDNNFIQKWIKPWSYPIEYEYGQPVKIIQAIEGDGYVMLGNQNNYPWDWDVASFQKMIEQGNVPKTESVLEKIDNSGERQWLRSLSIVNFLDDYYIMHELTDIIKSPDGNYILYGSVHWSRREGDSIWNNPAWLLKVDQFGCLVPGCQNSDTVSVTDEIGQKELLIYPNPSSDILCIYDNQGGESKYVISDINGNPIIKWSGNLKDHTYIVQLHDFNPGVYIVSRINDRGRVRSGKFVKGER